MSSGAPAVLSERHLQGVKSLNCELETSESEFTPVVNTKDRTLTLGGAGAKLPYTDVSDSVLRFPLKLPGKSSALECDLELPAGSLNCAPPGAARDSQEGRVLGFCMTVS